MPEFAKGDKVKFRMPFQGDFAHGTFVGPSDEDGYVVVDVVETVFGKRRVVPCKVRRNKLIKE